MRLLRRKLEPGETTLADVVKEFERLATQRFRFLEDEHGCTRTVSPIDGYLSHSIKYRNHAAEIAVSVETRENDVAVSLKRAEIEGFGKEGVDRWFLDSLIDVHEPEAIDRRPRGVESLVEYYAAKLRAYGEPILRGGDFSQLEAWEEQGGWGEDWWER